MAVANRGICILGSRFLCEGQGGLPDADADDDADDA